MEQVLDAFDMLDIVLAIFGALVTAMWFGRGQGLGGLLSGAIIGGLIKPAIIIVLSSGIILAAQQSLPQEIKQTPAQQQKTLDFWLK